MAEIKEMTAEEVLEQLKNGEQLNLIDVREDEEVAAGMIPEAKHVRMGTIPERLNEFDKDKEYIFVCRSGGRSHNTCMFMQEQGFKVVNMVGGMMSWPGDTESR
ncbi:rhodanese-like domain-containing protein [Bacillus tianshenii]|nr:rhodanese-like domain-containing protein [Bacillus tianshenii]